MARIIASVFFLFALPLGPRALCQPRAEEVRSKRIQFTLQYTVQAPKPPRKATLTVLVPRDMPGQQKILKLTYSHTPAREFEEFGNKYAVFVLEPPPPNAVIKVDVAAEIHGFDLDQIDKVKPRLEKKDNLKRYLVHEAYLEKDAQEIIDVAKNIQGKDEIALLRNIMKFVGGTLRRGPYDSKDRGALWALNVKVGDCTEFADLFVALCRAKGIPARVCEGYVTHDVQNVDTPKHNWVEAYTEKYGWLSIDPFHIFLKAASFERKRPYICLSTVRTDPRVMYFHFWAYRFEGGGNMSVQDAYIIHRQEELPKK